MHALLIEHYMHFSYKCMQLYELLYGMYHGTVRPLMRSMTHKIPCKPEHLQIPIIIFVVSIIVYVYKGQVYFEKHDGALQKNEQDPHSD